jgi:hypothetical protein
MDLKVSWPFDPFLSHANAVHDFAVCIFALKPKAGLN